MGISYVFIGGTGGGYISQTVKTPIKATRFGFCFNMFFAIESLQNSPFLFFFQLIDPWRPKRRTAAVELRADVTQSIVRQPFSWRAPDHRQHGKAGARKGGLGARNPVVKTCFKASFSLPKWPLQMGGSPFSDTKNGLVHATAICRLIVHRYRLSIHSFYVYIHSFDSMYTYIIF